MHRHIWNIIFLNFISARYDILYSFTSHGTLFHPKQIVTVHDLISLSFPKSHLFQYYYFKFLIPHLLRRSKHVIAISQFTKSEVIKHYGLKSDKISVIYNGIDHLEKFDEVEQDENWVRFVTDNMPFCLCVGASYVHKNIETLLMVCDRLRHLKVKFLIVNKPNPYYESLKKKAENLNLNNVIFLPYVTKEQLALLYKQARLNIYLSLYEGFGFPPAEATFFQTYSILSKQPALIEVYGEEFDYSDPFDVNQIEKVVLQYVLSEKKQSLGVYKELKQKYNWDKTAQQTMNLLNKL